MALAGHQLTRPLALARSTPAAQDAPMVQEGFVGRQIRRGDHLPCRVGGRFVPVQRLRQVVLVQLVIKKVDKCSQLGGHLTTAGEDGEERGGMPCRVSFNADQASAGEILFD